MKNLVLKTALITLSATVFLIFLIFGICALCAPTMMMNVTSELGMRAQSGNYAFRAFKKEGSLRYLAYACEVAIVTEDDEKIIERLDVFFAEDEFEAYCLEQDAKEQNGAYANHISGGYEQYLYGGYACALYRNEQLTEAIDFAIDAAGEAFPANNAVIALVYEGKEDAEFCGDLADALKESAAKENETCKDIINILEDFANE